MVDIYDWNDLDAVRNDLTASYTLQNDLDSSTAGYTGIGDDFQPIGTFNGQFDGQGNAIQDLVISVAGEGVALFKEINGNTTNTVIIENLSISGSVTNTGTSNQTAGLVGYFNSSGNGEIRECVSHVDVTGNDSTGGLVGYNESTITNCYATGSIDGGSFVAGLVGYNFNTVQTSYSVGSVTGGSSDVGGVVGNNQDIVTDCYWDTETSGISSSSPGTGLTTSEMQGQEASTNMGGFDFTNVWETVLTEDADTSADGYPILQSVDRQNQLEAQGILFQPNPIIVDGVAYDVFVDGTQYSAELQ